MNLKPAGIKTVREAIERVMAGEVFYSPEGWKIIYDDSNMSCRSGRLNPFRVVERDGISEPINALWKKVSDWQIECKWEDDIGYGVLCWVSDSNPRPSIGDRICLIVNYNSESD